MLVAGALAQAKAGTLTALLLDKGGQVFNVLAYNTVGAGIADDTAAVNNARAAAIASNGVLWFPAGKTYAISQFAAASNLTVYAYGATILHRVRTYRRSTRPCHVTLAVMAAWLR